MHALWMCVLNSDNEDELSVDGHGTATTDNSKIQCTSRRTISPPACTDILTPSNSARWTIWGPPFEVRYLGSQKGVAGDDPLMS